MTMGSAGTTYVGNNSWSSDPWANWMATSENTQRQYNQGQTQKQDMGGDSSGAKWASLITKAMQMMAQQMNQQTNTTVNTRTTASTMPEYMDKGVWARALRIEEWMQSARNRAIAGQPVSLAADVSQMTRGGAEPAPKETTRSEEQRRIVASLNASRNRGQAEQVQNMERMNPYLAASLSGGAAGTGGQYGQTIMGTDIAARQAGISRLLPSLQALTNTQLLAPPFGQTSKSKSKTTVKQRSVTLPDLQARTIDDVFGRGTEANRYTRFQFGVSPRETGEFRF